MQVIKEKRLFVLALVLISPLAIFTSPSKAGTFGAEIFCTMRDGGNDHESSWEAAYSYIKKQKGGIFKVSPKQAAAQIVETVVREKDEFDYCVEYLNQLHPDRKLQRELKKEEQRRRKLKESLDDTEREFSEETIERYSY